MKLTDAGKAVVEHMMTTAYAGHVFLAWREKGTYGWETYQDGVKNGTEPDIDGEDYEDFVLVIGDAFEDDAYGYVDTLNIANFREWRDYVISEDVFTTTGPWSHVSCAGVDLLNLGDMDAAESITDAVDSHADYPIGAEGMSDVEMELLGEYVSDGELLSDVTSRWDGLGSHTRLTELAKENEDVVRDTFYQWMSDVGIYPEWEYLSPYFTKDDWADFILTVAKALRRV